MLKYQKSLGLPIIESNSVDPKDSPLQVDRHIVLKLQ